MTTSPSPLVVTSNRSGWVWVGLCGLIGLFAAYDCFARGYVGLGLTVLVWTALLIAFIALVFVLPRLTVDEAGATVRNVLFSVRVPWGQLEDTRSTMFVELLPRGGEPVRVWAAPQSAMKRGRASLRNRAQLEVEVPEERGPRLDVASSLLVERDRALSAGNNAVTSGPVTRTFLKREWSLFGALAVVALVSLFLV
ncbi:MAG: PH domain-containing protein [Arthrobacter sp.]|nr:PH domain-containing protein [Arthrobacter sp.]